MSDRIGYVNYSENEYNMKTYSDATNRVIDEEVKRIIDECSVITRAMIKKHKSDVQNLSDSLLEKETIDLTEITRILGKRPFAPKSTFKAYLEEIEAEKKENEDNNGGEGGQGESGSSEGLKLEKA
jgi:AFG3 family protein